MARKPTAVSHLKPALVQIDVVVHDDERRRRRLEEARRRRNRTPRFVHIGLGLEQSESVIVDSDIREPS